jgi:MerR family transcriptional regulator, light-induced transcriptional regulator
LATLPGELHGLGLQMAAIVFAMAGWRILVLGVDTPIEQIAALTREVSIGAVAVSSVQSPDEKSIAHLRALRRQLPRPIPLILGGSGAPKSIQNTVVLSDLPALERWLSEQL